MDVIVLLGDIVHICVFIELFSLLYSAHAHMNRNFTPYATFTCTR